MQSAADGRPPDAEQGPHAAPSAPGLASLSPPASPGRWSGDRAFWGLTATQFLGAFNDNLFKQVLLLLFVAVPVSAAAGQPQTRDLQFAATLAFSLPFILFSGYAGYLSDRFSKRRVIVLSKYAEIAIMTAGALAFAQYGRHGMAGHVFGLLVLILFCMGAQSAFFGPGKYGILPELLRAGDLPPANGVILMTTFVAIILGSGLAGVLLDQIGGQLWLIGLACMAIAIVGTLTAHLVRPVPVARPGLAFEMSALTIPKVMRQLLRQDRALRQAVIASSVFWASAAMVTMSVNSLGKVQLQVGDTRTSILVSLISIGIAIGSLLAGWLSGDRFHTRVMKAGAWGLTLGLAIMALPTGTGTHLLGYEGSKYMLIVLGAFTGMFAVPLQVFMQSRPPEGLRGRMIATQNLLNWVGITLSAPLYALADWTLGQLGWPRFGTFALTALFMGAVSVLYRPHGESLAGERADESHAGPEAIQKP